MHWTETLAVVCCRVNGVGKRKAEANNLIGSDLVEQPLYWHNFAVVYSCCVVFRRCVASDRGCFQLQSSSLLSGYKNEIYCAVVCYDGLKWHKVAFGNTSFSWGTRVWGLVFRDT